jgi:hypothetical protein
VASSRSCSRGAFYALDFRPLSAAILSQPLIE